MSDAGAHTLNRNPRGDQGAIEWERQVAASELQGEILKFIGDPAAVTDGVLTALYRLRAARLTERLDLGSSRRA